MSEQKTVIQTPCGQYSLYSDGMYRGPSASNGYVGMPVGALQKVPDGVFAEANGEFIVKPGFEERVLNAAEQLKLETNTHPVVLNGKKLVILPVATSIQKKNSTREIKIV